MSYLYFIFFFMNMCQKILLLWNTCLKPPFPSFKFVFLSEHWCTQVNFSILNNDVYLGMNTTMNNMVSIIFRVTL